MDDQDATQRETLPPQTRVEAVLRLWRTKGVITYGQAEDAYCAPTASLPALDAHSREYVSMTLTRLLKRHGQKQGPPSSRAPWKLGRPTVSPAGGPDRPGLCHGCGERVWHPWDHRLACPNYTSKGCCDHCGLSGDAHFIDCLHNITETTNRGTGTARVGGPLVPDEPPPLGSRSHSLQQMDRHLEQLERELTLARNAVQRRELVERWKGWAVGLLGGMDEPGLEGVAEALRELLSDG